MQRSRCRVRANRGWTPVVCSLTLVLNYAVADSPPRSLAMAKSQSEGSQSTLLSIQAHGDGLQRQADHTLQQQRMLAANLPDFSESLNKQSSENLKGRRRTEGTTTKQDEEDEGLSESSMIAIVVLVPILGACTLCGAARGLQALREHMNKPVIVSEHHAAAWADLGALDQVPPPTCPDSPQDLQPPLKGISVKDLGIETEGPRVYTPRVANPDAPHADEQLERQGSAPELFLRAIRASASFSRTNSNGSFRSTGSGGGGGGVAQFFIGERPPSTNPFSKGAEAEELPADPRRVSLPVSIAEVSVEGSVDVTAHSRSGRRDDPRRSSWRRDSWGGRGADPRRDSQVSRLSRELSNIGSDSQEISVPRPHVYPDLKAILQQQQAGQTASRGSLAPSNAPSLSGPVSPGSTSQAGSARRVKNTILPQRDFNLGISAATSRTPSSASLASPHNQLPAHPLPSSSLASPHPEASAPTSTPTGGPGREEHAWYQPTRMVQQQQVAEAAAAAREGRGGVDKSRKWLQAIIPKGRSPSHAAAYGNAQGAWLEDRLIAGPERPAA